MAFADLPVNPFAQTIVSGPRERPPSVDSLNRAVLDRVLANFQPLGAALPGDCDQPAAPATLVLSNAPGYGKSHLVTRLFTALAGRATLVWVQPFQAPSLCWHSLLLQAVNELRQPDAAAGGGLTQLDLLAQRVLRAVAASALAHGELRPEGWEALGAALIAPDWWDLRRPEHEAAQWLLATAASHHRLLAAELERVPGQAVLRNVVWLRILTAWVTRGHGSIGATACLAWLRGQALEEEERLALGVGPAEGAPPESEEALNALAHDRIHDLCALARFHRPWLFCFDQTEDYGSSPRLAATFGFLVARLINEHPNQFTVVTANKDVWERRIWPEVDTAHLDRFASPLRMVGLNRTQARELIEVRLARWSVDPAVAERFADPTWLDRLFPGPTAEFGPRDFLRQCQLRWADGGAIPAPPALSEVFAEFRARVAGNPRLLAFAPDPFRWLIRGPLAAPGAGSCVEAPDPEIELRWPAEGRGGIEFTFGFGWSFQRWGKLAKRLLPPGAGANRPAKIVVFRTPDLDPVPKPGWKVNGSLVRSAFHHGLHLILLTEAETAELYAARQLFLEAEGGNVDGHDAAAVLEFLRDALAGWRARLLGPVEIPEPPPVVKSAEAGPDPAVLARLLRQEKFLSAPDAASRLGRPWNAAAVLVAAAELPAVEVIASSAMTVLLWRG